MAQKKLTPLWWVGTISKELSNAAVQECARILTDARVPKIQVQNGIAMGVLLSDERSVISPRSSSMFSGFPTSSKARPGTKKKIAT